MARIVRSILEVSAWTNYWTCIARNARLGLPFMRTELTCVACCVRFSVLRRPASREGGAGWPHAAEVVAAGDLQAALGSIDVGGSCHHRAMALDLIVDPAQMGAVPCIRGLRVHAARPARCRADPGRHRC